MTEKLTFQNVLDHLRNSSKNIPQSHFKFYSDLDPKSLRQFMDAWRDVAPARKLILLDELLARLDSDTIVSYEEIGRELLADADAQVRTRAIGLLAESNDPRIVNDLTDILLRDVDLAPRIQSARLLGEFILLAELEELPEETQRKAESALRSVIKSGDDSSLRKQALESFGYSSNAELNDLIESAFERADPAWVASALRAMGRSKDSERWGEDVTSMLLDEEPQIRHAAVEAAGELLIEEAAPIMINMLEDEEEDEDVASAAIWSLSQIGGEDARVYLIHLIEQTEDENLLEYLEDALDNLNFNEDLNKFDLLSLDEDDLDDEGG
ncbi:MAG: HEAT repeat domain-containing protein [Anaerolineales bacterium]|nr:HEAT repeat domain-containing protein [Anaerolineales bacterium]